MKARGLLVCALLLAVSGGAAAQKNKNLEHAKKASAALELSPGRELKVVYHALYWSAKAFDGLDGNDRLREFYNGFIRQMLRMELTFPVPVAVLAEGGAAAGTMPAGTFQATFLHRGKDGWRFVIYASDGRTVGVEVPLSAARAKDGTAPFAATLRASEKPGEAVALLDWTYGPLRAAVTFAAAEGAASRPAKSPAPK